MPQLIEVDRHVSLFEQMEEQHEGSTPPPVAVPPAPATRSHILGTCSSPRGPRARGEALRTRRPHQALKALELC
jgi:hypothetical protein